MNAHHEWRRRDLALGSPASRILAAATLCGSMILVAMAIAYFIVFTRGSFLTRWWDWSVVLLGFGGYFGGMRLLKVWERYSAKETAAGYTTNPFGFVDADLVHWPSGVVLRDSGDRHLTLRARRQRMDRVRAYEAWVRSTAESDDGN